ncbi:MAG: hypothetical protein HY706_11575 [Candidatus Hydrogenedentes bacterium]|nr:hypothetical protein [Candidatus Hydrogenedentota bacterium]
MTTSSREISSAKGEPRPGLLARRHDLRPAAVGRFCAAVILHGTLTEAFEVTFAERARRYRTRAALVEAAHEYGQKPMVREALEAAWRRAVECAQIRAEKYLLRLDRIADRDTSDWREAGVCVRAIDTLSKLAGFCEHGVQPQVTAVHISVDSGARGDPPADSACAAEGATPLTATEADAAAPDFD